VEKVIAAGVKAYKSIGIGDCGGMLDLLERFLGWVGLGLLVEVMGNIRRRNRKTYTVVSI
jgi:hypothetical protein